MNVTLTFWNRWVPVRKEQTADGTTSLYFGFGRLSWQHKAAESGSGSDGSGVPYEVVREMTERRHGPVGWKPGVPDSGSSVEQP